MRSSPLFSHGVAISVDFREGRQAQFGSIHSRSTRSVGQPSKSSLAITLQQVEGAQAQVVPRWKNNRENGSALNKLMTTRFSASAVMMELAAYLKHRALKAAVQWAPKIHQLRVGYSR